MITAKKIEVPEWYKNAMMHYDQSVYFEGEKHRKADKDEMFVTSLVGRETKEAILLERHSNEINPTFQDLASVNLGTIMHTYIEGFIASYYPWLETEGEISFELLNWMNRRIILTGHFDIYDDDTRTLYDLKFSKVATYNKNFSGESEEWSRQTACYVEGLMQKGKRVDRVVIIVFNLDWSAMKYGEYNYPEHIDTICWDVDDSFCQYIYDTVELLKAKAEEKLKYMAAPVEEIPTCSSKARFNTHDWAWMKPNVIRASKKFDHEPTEDEISSCLEKFGEGKLVERWSNEDIKCRKYCDACRFCDYGRKLMEENND